MHRNGSTSWFAATPETAHVRRRFCNSFNRVPGTMFGDAVHFSTDNENGPKIVIGVAALRKLERREGGGELVFVRLCKARERETEVTLCFYDVLFYGWCWYFYRNESKMIGRYDVLNKAIYIFFNFLFLMEYRGRMEYGRLEILILKIIYFIYIVEINIYFKFESLNIWFSAIKDIG